MPRETFPRVRSSSNRSAAGHAYPACRLFGSTTARPSAIGAVSYDLRFEALSLKLASRLKAFDELIDASAMALIGDPVGDEAQRDVFHLFELLETVST